MNKRLFILMASLLLCGTLSAQTYDWGDDPDSHAQPSNTPIVASVKLDGNLVTATNVMRLGAFVGNELRGIAAPHTDGKFWIQVYYTVTNNVADEITFKFYDGTDEYTTCETTLTGADEGYGTPGAPQVLNFTSSSTQSVALAEGWNWWSTNVETTLADLKAALVEADGNNGITITARNGEITYYNGNNWRGSLTTLDVIQSYMIQTTTNCEITLNGASINPADYPVTIIPGYNWIGFPYNEGKTVINTFTGFAISGDMIMSRNGNTAFYNGSSWRGSLTNLESGQGYIYYSASSENRTFVFPLND